VAGEFEAVREIPSIQDLLIYISQNPDLARWRTEIELREAAIDLEDARGVPNFTVTAGMQRFNETNDNAFILGFSIPFPVFNRNQGAKLEARYNLSKTLEEERAAGIRIRTDLEQIYQELSSSHLEVVSLKNDVVPAAQLAFDAANEGYLQGKFGYLEVLDAQRTLFQAQGQYILALAAYHKAVADMERLIGQRLEETSSTNPITEEASDEK
jgi:cobalt-zinc-cadmium efflux system outer membrane protein